MMAHFPVHSIADCGEDRIESDSQIDRMGWKLQVIVKMLFKKKQTMTTNGVGMVNGRQGKAR